MIAYLLHVFTCPSAQKWSNIFADTPLAAGQQLLLGQNSSKCVVVYRVHLRNLSLSWDGYCLSCEVSRGAQFWGTVIKGFWGHSLLIHLESSGSSNFQNQEAGQYITLIPARLFFKLDKDICLQTSNWTLACLCSCENSLIFNLQRITFFMVPDTKVKSELF